MTHTLKYINERGERVTARNISPKEASYIRESCVVIHERLHVPSTGQTSPRESDRPGVTVYVPSGFLARFWGKPDAKVELNPFQTRELMGRILKS